MHAAEPEPRPLARPADAAETKIAETLGRAGELGTKERSELLQQVAREVLKMKPDNLDVTRLLERSLQGSASAPSSELAGPQVETALRDALEVLAYRPLLEAPLPEGFPRPTPLGEIEIKNYPAYRMARTAMDGRTDEGRAFFTLFEHITKNQIAMTAPVEMTYAAEASRQANQTAMAFLYQSQATGNLQAGGAVTVTDVPPMTVVSYGIRGDSSPGRVSEGEQALRAWLEKDGQYEVVGKLRLMGYNSPMIPAQRRFAEVQLPVKKRDAGEAAGGSSQRPTLSEGSRKRE
jgi:hypothetical protein